jgi:hypothetical protein
MRGARLRQVAALAEFRLTRPNVEGASGLMGTDAALHATCGAKRGGTRVASGCSEAVMNTLTQSQILFLVGIVVLVVIGIIAWLAMRSARRRHVELRQRFGPEYERAVSEYGNEKRAERELVKREKRVNRLDLHPLREAERLRFEGEWRMVQTRFVDDPSGAVTAADELIQAVMHAHGYPVRDFEQRVEDLSVEHANVVQHYRAARILADANREGRADTEELRQAFVHYRALFADLLDAPGTAHGELRGAGAGA